MAICITGPDEPTDGTASLKCLSAYYIDGLGAPQERTVARNRMARILILVAGHLWSNPRSQKEAGALAKAGHSVHVGGIWFDQQGVERDLQIASGKAWRFEPFLDLRLSTRYGRTKSFLARVRNRLARELFSKLGLRSPELLGYGAREMLRTAIHESADLTIVRSEVGMWVGDCLLNRRRPVGVDFEDWYSEDMQPAARASRPVRWLKALERRAAADCRYVVAASRAMAEAIAAEYRVPAPQVVYNVFSLDENPGIDRAIKDRKNVNVPSVHWFSQTIGPDRGLESLFAAAGTLSHAFDIHLRGRLLPGYADWFASVVPVALRGRVFVHDTVPNEELLSRIAEHDIGLALEAAEPPSRNLTITNKMFQYMQAGLAIIATDTSGQREVFAQAPGMGLLIRNRDPDALARALAELLGDERRLLNAKRAAAAAFREKFNWEGQRAAVVRLAERAIEEQARTIP